MALFSQLYDKMIKWSGHRHATRYLAGFSFVESSVFPLPPDIMLVPMALAQRDKAWRYAFITAIFSVLGGIVGYLLGYFFIELLEPWLQTTPHWTQYQEAVRWVNDKGFLIIIIAGVLPIPYKFFTISAGALQVAFIPFLLASVIGRFFRFYLVSGLLVWKGERLHNFMIKYIERIGWICLCALGLGLTFIYLSRSGS